MYVRCAVCYLLYRLVHTLFNFQILIVEEGSIADERRRNTSNLVVSSSFSVLSTHRFVNGSRRRTIMQTKNPVHKIKNRCESETDVRDAAATTMTTTNRIRCVSRKEAMKMKWKKKLDIYVRFGRFVRISYIEKDTDVVDVDELMDKFALTTHNTVLARTTYRFLIVSTLNQFAAHNFTLLSIAQIRYNSAVRGPLERTKLEYMYFGCGSSRRPISKFNAFKTVKLREAHTRFTSFFFAFRRFSCVHNNDDDHF